MIKKRVWKPLAGIIYLILLLSVVVFFYILLDLNILPDKYLLLVIGAYAVLMVLTALLLYLGINHKHHSQARRIQRIAGVILAFVLAGVSLAGSFVLLRVGRTKDNIATKPDDEFSAVVSVYVKNDDPAQTLADLNGYRTAVLAGIGDESVNSNYAVDQINAQLGEKLEPVAFRGVTDAAIALRDGEADAIAVNSNFFSMLSDTETLSGFVSELRLVGEIGVPTGTTLDSLAIVVQDPENPETAEPTPTPEPTPVPLYGENDTMVFFLSGVDKWESGVSNTHSDANILMFVNTKTKQILLINTPRDTFLDNPAIGGGDKLTHCGVQGVRNSANALENFYGCFTVDNYVKINFRGFEKFVNSIHNIRLYNPVAFDSKGRNGMEHFDEGEIVLNGYRALIYARERHAFANGDIGRGQNHLRVLTAIIQRFRNIDVSVILNYPEILESMEGMFETDLTSDQMSDLVKIGLDYLYDWDVKSYAVWGVNGMRVTASGGSEPLYIIWPNDNSVEFAKKLMVMIQNDEIITDELLAEAPLY